MLTTVSGSQIIKLFTARNKVNLLIKFKFYLQCDGRDCTSYSSAKAAVGDTVTNVGHVTVASFT